MNQELKEMEKSPNMLAFQVALAFAFYSIILMIIQRATGFMADAPDASTGGKVLWGALSYIVFILAVVFVQKKHKTEMGGYISFGRAFSAGFRTSVYAGLFFGILMIIYYKLYDPSALTDVIANARTAAALKSNNDPNAQKGIDMMAPYMPYFIAFSAAIIYAILGLLVSLIGAAILKKEGQVIIEEETTISSTPSE